MDAAVTLKLTVSELDTIRAAMSALIDARAEVVADASEHASVRAKARAEATEARELLARINA